MGEDGIPRLGMNQTEVVEMSQAKISPEEIGTSSESNDRRGPGFRIGASARRPDYILQSGLRLRSSAGNEARSALQRFLGSTNSQTDAVASSSGPNNPY